MVDTMHVEVVSAESHVLSADVTELYARSTEGEFGILPGHQPGLFALDIAPVTLKYEDGTAQRVAVHRGTLFVDKDSQIILLADIAEFEDDIDVERARKRQQEMERRIAEGDDDPVLKASLTKQNVRMQVADQPVEA